MSEQRTKIDWPALVFDKGFLAEIEKLSKRRFGQGVLSEECATYVIEKLAEDNWQRCRKYQGKSKPLTFLFVMASNYIEEFARTKYGRARPPVWLKDLGNLWVSIWKAVCLERQMIESVVARFSEHGLRSRAVVQDIITTIKARIPSCGAASAGVCESADGDIEGLSDALEFASSTPTPPMTQEAEVQKSFYSLVSALLPSNEQTIHKPLDAKGEFSKLQTELSITEGLSKLAPDIRLTDEQILLLRMVYLDGLPKGKAGAMLGFAAHQGVRLINDALAQLRHVFAQGDFDIDAYYRAFDRDSD